MSIKSRADNIGVEKLEINKISIGLLFSILRYSEKLTLHATQINHPVHEYNQAVHQVVQREKYH